MAAAVAAMLSLSGCATSEQRFVTDDFSASRPTCPAHLTLSCVVRYGGSERCTCLSRAALDSMLDPR